MQVVVYVSELFELTGESYNQQMSGRPLSTLTPNPFRGAFAVLATTAPNMHPVPTNSLDNIIPFPLVEDTIQ